jgi:hypothetical protein
VPDEIKKAKLKKEKMWQFKGQTVNYEMKRHERHLSCEKYS